MEQLRNVLYPKTNISDLIKTKSNVWRSSADHSVTVQNSLDDHGPAVDVVLGSGEAGIATYQSRMKEKKYEESGGVKGYSRTRANKEIATEWSKKAVGTVGGMGSAALLTSGAAMAGQVNHPPWIT